MEPPSTSPDSQPSSPEKPQRHFPIKGLIIFLVAAQPVLVAISLYYTEVYNKKEPPLCDPVLRTALLESPRIPSSDYYKADPDSQEAYEEGWLVGYRQAIDAILEAGCNGLAKETLPAYAAPVGTVESARANGRNDGALAAQQLPRECLNECWRLVIRRPVPQAPVQ